MLRINDKLTINLCAFGLQAGRRNVFVYVVDYLCLPFFVLKFAETASMHSFGGIRQQFTIPENILMSLFTSQFVKNAQVRNVDRLLFSSPASTSIIYIYIYLKTMMKDFGTIASSRLALLGKLPFFALL